MEKESTGYNWVSYHKRLFTGLTFEEKIKLITNNQLRHERIERDVIKDFKRLGKYKISS